MSNTLGEVAQQLKDAQKKVQLIYAFNGTGKTRLSREFKKLIADNDGGEPDGPTSTREKILYYNAFTEDLFYWDNDLEVNLEPKLKIQPNTYTDWLLTLLKDLGQDGNIVKYFQHYTNDKLTPNFSADLTEVTFTFERGDDENFGNLKISKGEESNFIWSVFYTLLDQVITILNVADPTDRETNQFDQLEYVFIDDPVSSLDENHLIQLAIDLARLIKSSDSNLKFVITTHNPLFYNVMYNEFSRANKYIFRKSESDTITYKLMKQDYDSPFSYHLYLKNELLEAANSGDIHKYHFNFLRNVLEKTSTFLGYNEWGELLPVVEGSDSVSSANPYARIINLYNHDKHSADEIKEVHEDHKRVFKFLVGELDKIYKGNRQY
ncbi:AAA family ATPase [Acinetobacter lwoffii]|uniref:AAA family ATPase n=1 Tax=Acinetobacter lwoffii TaxID=28090 RepID=A0AAJ4TSW9_ACILW|nr:AAA family ATPase [Acinetobacter sp. AR2-3]OIU87027.1 anticodon nuclease [Acinetobacter sp. AR2-3]QXR06809.1 AAA family ATPase [Acinetobacter lwoffii]